MRNFVSASLSVFLKQSILQIAILKGYRASLTNGHFVINCATLSLGEPY